MATTPAIIAYQKDGTVIETSRAQFDKVWKPAGCVLTKPSKTKKSGTAGEGT